MPLECSRVRPFVTLRWLLPLALASATVFSASAEVIHLKNGDVIYADSVRDGANRVEYSVGDNTYAIPKSRVLSVDSGTRPQAAPEAQSEIATYTPDAPMAGDQEILSKIVRDGHVDRVALEAIASGQDRKQTATAFYLAGKQDYINAKYSDARHDFEMALANDPENPGILNYYAALLIRIGSAREAVPYAEQAVHLAPDSPTPSPFSATRSSAQTIRKTPSSTGKNPWPCARIRPSSG